MKKMLSLLIALILATACFAAFAEEEAPQPQPVPDPDRFGGVWECDRLGEDHLGVFLLLLRRGKQDRLHALRHPHRPDLRRQRGTHGFHRAV